MTLQNDMDSKRNWTQGEIDALKSKYRRTHFTHFKGVGKLKRMRNGTRKRINGVMYVWKDGRWT